MSIPDNRSLKFSQPTTAEPLHWLVYRKVGDLFVFLSADLAIHLDAIHRALSESRTWGEFRRGLPTGEWPEIEHRLFLSEDEVEEEDRSHWEDDDAPFLRHRVCGVDDTEYPFVNPVWLGDVEDLPNAVITAHAQTLLTPEHRFIHWHVPVEGVGLVVSMLRHWGYVVDEADYLAIE